MKKCIGYRLKSRTHKESSSAATSRISHNRAITLPGHLRELQIPRRMAARDDSEKFFAQRPEKCQRKRDRRRGLNRAACGGDFVDGVLRGVQGDCDVNRFVRVIHVNDYGAADFHYADMLIWLGDFH